ncbi:uncharacterized protein EDB91DRAFT_1112947 [Suillus paluster]|uniref:uncharacterized protein n=1 Tax=Suillus paluster TaxID=48578 RepID=UPI001B86B11D|nr:uncharacterized protein EDB91DRAFT_1112947 [Suillus paluster]KAG1748258.1 hypothetical protein EDB91DRAFT_1112947 [Suillus paluster]
MQAISSVAVLLIAWATRISKHSRKLLLIVLIVSSGVVITSKGERRFSSVGFFIQAEGVGPPVSCSSKPSCTGSRRTPLVSLQLYAPV